MIHGLRPYPAYKESGVPWLGEVPEHWDILPALAAYKPRLEKNTGMIERTVLSLSYGRIIVRSTGGLRGLMPESFEGYQIVAPGNIIVRSTDLQNDRSSLRIGHAKSRGIITAAYMCLETTDLVCPQFGYQFLNACDLSKALYAFGSGLRQNLEFSHIKRMLVLVPRKDEQSAIVRFLDHADRRIQRYIRAKKKLIALLNEQKQAIIHRAVTRGLDPDVRMKPSGVEWLGEVPEHWEVVPNGSMIRSKRELVGDRSKKFTLLSLTLRGIVPRNLESPSGKFPSDFGMYQVVDQGDLVFCLFDMDETPRTVGIASGRGMVTGAYDVFSCSDSDVAEFIYFFYLAVDGRKGLRPFYSGLRKVVKRSVFLSIKLAVPPKSELQGILSFVASESRRVDDAVERAQSEIDLLREYRTRLIADVVTGKLDVREAAARLPEEAEAAEAFEEDETLGEEDDDSKNGESELDLEAEG